MKHLSIILLIIIFTPFASTAQNNYRPGYVVTLKGDTIRGFINYKEWDANPNEISFKTTVADNIARKLTPANTAFLNIDGQVAYQRYAGVISMDATDENHLSTGRDASFKMDTVFLKVIQKGKNVGFYSYFDGLKTRFYTADKPDYSPVELGYHLYTGGPVDVSQSQSGTVVDRMYQKQLFALAQKYGKLTDAMQNDIQHADYKKYDILPIITQINGISKEEYDKTYKAKTKVRLFGSAALSITTIKPTGMYKNAGGKTETCYFPALSVGMDLFTNPNVGTLLFRMEGMISENQYKSLTIYTGSPYIPVRYSYKQTCLALAPQVIYNFYVKGDLAVYGGAGVALTFYEYSNATYDLNYAATQARNAPLKSAGFFHTFGTPVLLKAGVKFSKNLGFFVNYLTSTPVTVDIPFSLNASTIQAGLNYNFN